MPSNKVPSFTVVIIAFVFEVIALGISCFLTDFALALYWIPASAALLFFVAPYTADPAEIIKQMNLINEPAEAVGRATCYVTAWLQLINTSTLALVTMLANIDSGLYQPWTSAAGESYMLLLVNGLLLFLLGCGGSMYWRELNKKLKGKLISSFTSYVIAICSVLIISLYPLLFKHFVK